MHNIIDGEHPPNLSKTMTTSQRNLQLEIGNGQLRDSENQYDQYPNDNQTRKPVNTYIHASNYAQREGDSNFVSSYCTVDNRRLPKHRGGLAERHRQREWLQRSAMHQTEGSSTASSEVNQTPVQPGQHSNPESAIILRPNFDKAKTIWSPPKPPRKSLLNSSSSSNLYASKPASSPIKSKQQFYNAYEPSKNINITRHEIDYQDGKIKNEDYINEVNKEIDDNLRFIKEVVSKNAALEASKIPANTNSTMKTFGSMPKESAVDTEDLPPPPSYLFNGDVMIENLESNNRLQSPPTPPPPPPPPQPLLPPSVPNRLTDGMDMAIGRIQTNETKRSSLTETVSEKSEVSDLDLSMLPLDAKSWSQRLERTNIINSNNISNGRQLAKNGKRHNYENHDIKTVRIAPKVTEIGYLGKYFPDPFRNYQNQMRIIRH